MTLLASTLPALPLFPLQTVLFPGGTLVLQIFELRYLDMVRQCHREGRPFGVVGLTSGTEVRRAGAATEAFHDVGVLAKITALETLQPALLQLQCVGTHRFQCTQTRQQPNGLWLGEATLLPDDAPTRVPPDLEACANRLGDLLVKHGLSTEDKLDHCGWVANRWCDILPLPNPVKHRLMALDNPLLRLELVNDLLEQQG